MAFTVWPRHIKAPPISHLATRNNPSRRTNARAIDANKPVNDTTFRFEPSAIDGRYNVSIETGTHPYVKFGAVLTREEVQKLIDCLSRGLRDTDEEEEEIG